MTYNLEWTEEISNIFLQVMFIEINTLNWKWMFKRVISFPMGKRRNNLRGIRAKRSLFHI